MPTTATGSEFAPNDFSNYLIGGNLCNAFALGNVGAPNDFWMVGAPALEVDAYPIITGNFLDAEGNPLFRIVKNVLTVNPRDCAKIYGNHIGYEIHDGQGNPIIKIETTQQESGQKSMLVTTIHGTFYDALKQPVVTFGGDKAESAGNCPVAYGLGPNGQWVMPAYMSNEQQEIASWVARTHGAVNEIVTGAHREETIKMDGTLFKNAQLEKCKLLVETGDFWITGPTTIRQCSVEASGAAERVGFLVARIIEGKGNPQK